MSTTCRIELVCEHFVRKPLKIFRWFFPLLFWIKILWLWNTCTNTHNTRIQRKRKNRTDSRCVAGDVYVCVCVCALLQINKEKWCVKERTTHSTDIDKTKSACACACQCWFVLVLVLFPSRFYSNVCQSHWNGNEWCRLSMIVVSNVDCDRKSITTNHCSVSTTADTSRYSIWVCIIKHAGMCARVCVCVSVCVYHPKKSHKISYAFEVSWENIKISLNFRKVHQQQQQQQHFKFDQHLCFDLNVNFDFCFYSFSRYGEWKVE